MARTPARIQQFASWTNAGSLSRKPAPSVIAACRVMMPDDLDRVRHLRRAVAVMKMESVRSPGILQRPRGRKLPVVISRQNDQLAQCRQSLKQITRRLGRRGAIVNNVADDDEVARSIVRDQLPQPVFDRGHPPHRQEASRRSLA